MDAQVDRVDKMHGTNTAIGQTGCCVTYFIFTLRKPMFAALEHMFMVVKLMFTAHEHNFSRYIDTFFF